MNIIKLKSNSVLRASMNWKSVTNRIKVLKAGTVLDNASLMENEYGEKWWGIPSGFLFAGGWIEVIDEPQPLPPMSLNDPMTMEYASQWGLFANRKRSDCGFACDKMFLKFYLNVDKRVDDLSAFVADPHGYSDEDDLIRCASLYGLALQAKSYKSLFDIRLPAIVYMLYAGLNRDSVQDKKFRGWHWEVLLKVNEDGSTINHDPDWWFPKSGAFRVWSAAESRAAFFHGTNYVRAITLKTQ